MTALARASETGAVAVTVAAIRAQVLRRRLRVVGILMLVLLAVSVVAVLVGDYPITPDRVWAALSGSGERVENYVVYDVRAPRLAMGILVGAALGVAGALLQSLLGNPLASPDLLGISGGSCVGAVVASVVFGASGGWLALAAFVGGIAVAAFLLFAGRRRDGGYRLILAGIGVSFITLAITQLVLVRAKSEVAQTAFLWMVGSLASTPWWNVIVLAIICVLAVPAVIACRRWLPIVQFGRESAVSLGVPTDTVRVVAVVTAVLLTAASAAFAGPISFIALCAPAIARPLLGHGAVGLGTSAAVGASLLVTADLAAQFAFANSSVPVGVVTGAIGAIFLLWLLASSKGRRL